LLNIGGMVTPQHEAMHRIFQHDRELFARTMHHVFHEDVPVPLTVSILDTDMTEARPHIRRGDSVLLAELLVEGKEDKYIVIVESQMRRDEEKERRWPYYIAYLHDKYECPVVLLVVCNDVATSAWARTPITVGLSGLTCMIVLAWVLGPDNLSPVTDPVQAKEDVGLAVLAAITHSQSGQINEILDALAEALDTIDTSTATVLAELAEAGLADTDGLLIWRALMATSTYPYVSHLRSQGREEGRQEGLQEGRQEGRAEGRQEGRAEAIVQVLMTRHVQISDADRERILACREDDTLTSWLERAALITDVGELFAPLTA
jgi:hypothetical protein